LLGWSVLSTHSSRISVTIDVSVATALTASKPAHRAAAKAFSTYGAPNTTASHAPRRLPPIKYSSHLSPYEEKADLIQSHWKTLRLQGTLTMRSPRAYFMARQPLRQSPDQRAGHTMFTGFCNQYNLRTHLPAFSNPATRTAYSQR
jgi:hypothetical protein